MQIRILQEQLDRQQQGFQQLRAMNDQLSVTADYHHHAPPPEATLQPSPTYHHHPYASPHHGLAETAAAHRVAAPPPRYLNQVYEQQQLLRQQQQQQLLGHLHPEDALLPSPRGEQPSPPLPDRLLERTSDHHLALLAAAESQQQQPLTKRKATASAEKKTTARKPRKKRKSAAPAATDAKQEPLDAMAQAAGMVRPLASPAPASLATLLRASDEVDQRDTAAELLATVFAAVEPWWNGDEAAQAVPPSASIETQYFGSSIPAFPTEEAWNRPEAAMHLPPAARRKEDHTTAAAATATSVAEHPEQVATSPIDASNKKKSTSSPGILEFPYAVDDWWPTVNGMKRERRNGGDTTDEDDFADTTTVASPRYRANGPKIRRNLAKTNPGVLEKVPHCRLHRVRTARRQKNGTLPNFTPNLLYCSQVTELYPEEVMVNCSMCGTWRHAACGGHHQNYSVQSQTDEPYVAVCEMCHAEKTFLQDNRAGAARLDRQRIEHVRRGLATSSVMRHFSYSKHGGTYKWPLGSVSATHISGHTRSVHTRHEKADKQWSDLVGRLAREFGYRPKVCVKSRTKELERLLGSIEDAEGYTDRHNMYLFLRRDTAKDTPAGWEEEERNLMDPAEDVEDGNDNTCRPLCVRPHCTNHQRFDSRFCSEACGVSTLELDLMQTLEYAAEMHPSVLRSTF